MSKGKDEAMIAINGLSDELQEIGMKMRDESLNGRVSACAELTVDATVVLRRVLAQLQSADPAEYESASHKVSEVMGVAVAAPEPKPDKPEETKGKVATKPPAK